MKIYTKTGDQGETSYIGGRISKAADMIECVGDLDELNAAVSLISTLLPSTLAKAKSVKSKSEKDNFTLLRGQIHEVQSQLLHLGAIIANPTMSEEESEQKQTQIEGWITELEQRIDSMDRELPLLQNFILPSGSQVGIQAHMARTIARRAERSSVRLLKGLLNLPAEQAHFGTNLQQVQKYLNRLSDWLFMLARWLNKQLGTAEEVWYESEQMRLEIK